MTEATRRTAQFHNNEILVFKHFVDEMGQPGSVIVKRYRACEHCAGLNSPAEVGEGKNEAIWLDENRNTDGHLYHICDECLRAGCTTAPGYRLAFPDEQEKQ